MTPLKGKLLKKLVETLHVDKATIIGVPFYGLKGIGTKTIYDTKLTIMQSNPKTVKL